MPISSDDELDLFLRFQHEIANIMYFRYERISLVYSLLPKDLTIQNLFIFTAAGVVACGGRKTSSHTSL